MADNRLSHNDQNDPFIRNLEALEYAERIKYTLFDISNAVNTTHDLEVLYQFIYEALNKLIHLPNFYIALYDKRNKTLDFEYFIDEYDENFPIKYASKSPNSLTEEMIQGGRPILLQENVLIERGSSNRMKGTLPKIWLGAPLSIRDKVMGAVCIQHYTQPDYFSHTHLEILVCVAGQIATAIERKQILDDLEKEKRILGLIARHTRSIVFIVSADGIYEFANPAHDQLGYDPSNLMDSSFFDLVHPGDNQMILNFLEKGIHGHIFNAPMTFRLKNKAGNFNQLDGTFELIRNNDGFLEKIIFIGRISSKKKAILPEKETSKNILIIEDEDTVRAMTLKTLRAFGYTPLEARDGEEGIDIYQAHFQKIDAVLLDIILPGISGAKAFQRMRAINPRAKIIITSGHVTGQDQERRFPEAAAFIEKPFQIMDLKKILSSVLE